MHPKKPERCVFVPAKIWPHESAIPSEKEYRQFCTEAFKDLKLIKFNSILDGLKQKHANWSRPTIHGMTLEKKTKSQWLG
jgi:hypothetical protein